ncbi:uncharacterized protein LOC127265875 [Andrographis paniculata]|uniref:uncharacterized protein LOC127265875 n=1 Tax=Andrographis paniculata TaxID=175694 RepID=UPI0021E90F52|nr:uncharacterized protein LOC127265875 [Andrographis paniculata]
MLSSRGLLGDQGIKNLEFCEHYIFGKQKKVGFSITSHRTHGVLDYIHSDLWGLSKVPSFTGKRYLMTLIDNFFRKIWVYFLRRKDEAFDTFKKWKAFVKNLTGLWNRRDLWAEVVSKLCICSAAGSKSLSNDQQQSGEKVELPMMFRPTADVSNSSDLQVDESSSSTTLNAPVRHDTYSIARDCPRRQIHPHSRFLEDYAVAYTLSVAQ